MFAGSRVVLADQEEIGIQEVADDGTERDEFGAVAEAEPLLGLLARMLLEDGQKAVAHRPGQDRARQDDGVPVWFPANRLADFAEGVSGVLKRESAAFVARRRNDDK